MDKRAIIIGGGIGGLCAAIALRQKGIEAIVYERAPELKEVGAGLSLWINAIKALNKIGLKDALRKLSIPQTGGGIRNAKGAMLSSAQRRNINNESETLILMVHRAELLDALLKKLGAEIVKLNAECTGFVQDENSVTARFANGSEARGSFLVGADGIHSAIRAALFGKQKPRYSGYTAWRAVVDFDHPSLQQGASETWGRGARFGIVPMSHKRVYWFATNNAPEGVSDSPQQRKQELINLFGGWHAPIPALIDATPESAILRNDIVDREPLMHWTKGRVTLLGDAAHPMTPNLGQGACQAIEDAVVLADCIAKNGNVEAALKDYEAQRVVRANRVVEQSHRIGKMAQNANPLVCAFRNAVIRMIPASMQMKQLNWIIEHEV
jgi:2-polyprenyl-6-methoxyphenol hydroxylase-like FAD-dependent oxidoreductase